MGVGINFAFVEREPAARLLELFNLDDARSIARAGWESPEIKLVRKLTSDHGTMNLSLGYDGTSVGIDINFHTETPGPSSAANTAARDAVAGRVVRLRDAAVRFLGDIYDLRLEEGGGDE